MKLTNIFEKKEEKKGTYAGLKFSEDTKKMITAYMDDNDIPNPLDVSKIHSTLLYSRNYLPDYIPDGQFEQPWKGKPTKLSIFGSNPKNGGDGSNCLVLEYKCSKQVARFDKLMAEHDATYDFDEYKPHITLSYDVGDLDYKNLPKIKKSLEIVEEYGEDLDLNYSG